MEATIGGTRRHIVDVARGLHERDIDVHLAVAAERDPDFPGDLDQLASEGIGVTRIPMVREVAPLKDLGHCRRLRALLKDLRPDIVHTHSSKAGVLGRTAALTTGIGRTVHTPHTFAFLFEALFGRAKRALYKVTETTLARRTDRLIAVSDCEADTFVRSGVVPEDRIRVVANGIDPAPFEAAVPFDVSTLGLDPEQPVAAVIGLLYAAKGQDLALDALAQPGHESLQLLIVGPGDASELVAQAERLGLTQRVRFLGARRDVPALLAALDFLVLPSRWEGMPYIVMEAMASGLPVVATPVDGAKELIVPTTTGLVADSIDAAALGRELTSILAYTEDERRKLGERGRKRLVEGYSRAAMVDGLLEVYAELT